MKGFPVRALRRIQKLQAQSDLQRLAFYVQWLQRLSDEWDAHLKDLKDLKDGKRLRRRT